MATWDWTSPTDESSFSCRTDEPESVLFSCSVEGTEYAYYRIIISSNSDATFNGFGTHILYLYASSGTFYENISVCKDTEGRCSFYAQLDGLNSGTHTTLETRNYSLRCWAALPYPTYTLGTPATGLKYKKQTAQSLLTSGGSCSGGTLYYGIGSSTSSAPGTWYSSSNYASLTGTNAGNYYIWYKVTGDSSHKSISQRYWTTVNIKERPESNIYVKTETGFKLAVPYTLTAINGTTYVWQQCSGYVKQEDGWHQLN